MLDTVSIFLHLLRVDLWPKMWSILENVPCALEKNVYFAVYGCNVLKISIKPIWSNMSFKACVSHTNFLPGWSVHWSMWGVKDPYYYCATVSIFMVVTILQTYWGAPLKVKVKLLSHVWLFATPWTVAHQAPPYLGFSRQEYWSGLPFPSPGDLPNPGIEPRSPTLQVEA